MEVPPRPEPRPESSAPEAIAEAVAQRPKIRLDMHTHTEFSPDSRTRLDRYARAAIASGLDAVCVTDHNTIDGALRLRELQRRWADDPDEDVSCLARLRVVVGEEIYSRDGEIVGLFLSEAVPSGRSAVDTMDRIHAQGGLVYIPHPFSRNRLRHMKLEQLNGLVDRIDAVEVFNAREVAASSNAKALAFALAHAKPGGVGSDAHRVWELGRAYVEIADFTTPQELLEALRQGTATGKLSGIFMHVRTWGDAAAKALGKLRR